MDTQYLLPFKVGDKAESMSFEKGYRGAWFRCKIKGTGDNKRGKFAYLLEFFDYPADRPRWTQLYQKLPYRPKSPVTSMQLMVRPSFPAVYHESEAPHPSTISDVIVVVHGTWKVGDLVDWWFDGCYWSGTISQVYQDGNYQIHLLEPPFGEGKFYKAKFTCLRPSLDWCPKLGWTVPESQGKGTHHTSVRLVHPCDADVEQGKSSLVDNSRSLASPEMGSSISSNRSPCFFSFLDDREEIERDSVPDDSLGNTSSGTTDSSIVAGGLWTSRPNSGKCLEDFEQKTESSVSPVELLAPAEMEAGKQNSLISSCNGPRETVAIIDGDEKDSNTIKVRKLSGKSSRIEQKIVSPVSCQLLAPAEMEIEKQNSVIRCKRPREMIPVIDCDGRDSNNTKVGNLSGRSSHDSGISSKKSYTSQSENLSKKLKFDSVELSIMELEEFANKIKWLQGTLKYGMNWPKAMRPSWNFSRPG